MVRLLICKISPKRNFFIICFIGFIFVVNLYKKKLLNETKCSSYMRWFISQKKKQTMLIEYYNNSILEGD